VDGVPIGQVVTADVEPSLPGHCVPRAEAEEENGEGQTDVRKAGGPVLVISHVTLLSPIRPDSAARPVVVMVV
jgi:hypothetical protein